MKSQKITVNNPADYSRGYNGAALKVIIVRGEITSLKNMKPENIAARGSNFSYSVATPVTAADEINTTFVQETNYGRQEIGSGRFDSVFCLKVNDQMPTWDSIRSEPELTILEVTGDDHPMTVDGVPTILNAFLGARIINHGSATVLNQQKVLNVDVIFRQKLTGADWKQKVGSSVGYPAEVSA